MSKLFGMSGAHGSGKSSILRYLRDTYPGSVTVNHGGVIKGLGICDRSASRETQEQMGFTSLADAVSTAEEMVEFQEQLMASMIRILSESRNIAPVVLVDRTFADVAAYAMLWTYRHLRQSPVYHTGLKYPMTWLPSYVGRCASMQLSFFSGTVFVPALHEIEFKAEPQRGDHETQAEHERYTRLFLAHAPAGSLPTIPLMSSDIPARAVETLRAIEMML